MPHILLDKTHTPLIEAAIKLGDWLLTLDDLSVEDKTAIKAVQAALGNLPDLNHDMLAMYGFSIETGDEHHGLVRGWDVSLEYFADDPEQQAGLELFSSYIPVPETDEPSVLAKKRRQEVYFHWPAGDICSFIQPESARQWIEQVTQPLKTVQAGDRLRIEVVYQQYYAERDYGLD